MKLPKGFVRVRAGAYECLVSHYDERWTMSKHKQAEVVRDERGWWPWRDFPRHASGPYPTARAAFLALGYDVTTGERSKAR